MRLIDADALKEVFANLIPWCIDTPEEVAFTKGLSSAYEATKNAPTIDAVPQWIPCEERLPDERQDVYVTVLWDDYGDYVTAYGMRTKFGWNLHSNTEGELIKGYTVVAWMPLPEPYDGERKDNGK